MAQTFGPARYNSPPTTFASTTGTDDTGSSRTLKTNRPGPSLGARDSGNRLSGDKSHLRPGRCRLLGRQVRGQVRAHGISRSSRDPGSRAHGGLQHQIEDQPAESRFVHGNALNTSPQALRYRLLLASSTYKSAIPGNALSSAANKLLILRRTSRSSTGAINAGSG